MIVKGLREIMSVVDLKSKGHKRHAFRSKHLEAITDEYGNNFVCPSYGFYFMARFSTLRRAIVTGSGLNVYPEEIELELGRIPAVAECCVLEMKIKEGMR
ncbi:MAG: hypothetical protein ABIA67_06355 [Candidatus Margulisiibacteriota bacterium]